MKTTRFFFVFFFFLFGQIFQRGEGEKKWEDAEDSRCGENKFINLVDVSKMTAAGHSKPSNTQ